MEHTQGAIRRMAPDDLETVLAWRNDANVRRYMFTQHEISPSEHRQWFERASNDPKRHLLIYECVGIPLGFVSIDEVALGGIADWGFYMAPDAAKGAGRALGIAALCYAFDTIDLHKLCGRVLAFNERSIQFHLKLGFCKEGVLQQHFYDGWKHHDVWCFGLLAKTWHAKY